MAKYLLLKHYQGGPKPHRAFPPMDQWAPEDVEAHMAFQRRAAAGLRETDRVRDVIGERHRWSAVRGYLYELDGDLPAAATAYAEAAARATNTAERDHLVRQAARAHAERSASPRSVPVSSLPVPRVLD